MADEVDDPVLVLEDLRRLAVGPLVHEADLEALVEEGHHLQPLHHRLGPELDLLEDGRVGPEGHGGAGPPPGRLAGDLELADRLAAVLELQDVVVTVAVDLQHQPGGQGVDHRDAHAVETAGHLVAAALAELAAGVEHGEHHLGRRLSLVLLHRVRWGCLARRRPPVPRRRPAGSRRSACSKPAMASSTELSTTSHTRWCSPVGPGRSDVHARAFADRVETLQHGDVVRVVRRSRSSLPSSSVFSATGAPFPTSSDWSGTGGDAVVGGAPRALRRRWRSPDSNAPV